ncbi:hypothetical protein EJB05_09657, partial [Eragrostis curvula]
MPSSSRRRRRRKNKPPSPASEARDWASLPRDILVDVFLRLGPCSQIMRGAERACMAWRRVAVDEPLLWRRIDVATLPLWSGLWLRKGRAMAVRAAVDRSGGQCESFYGNVDDESLLYLVESSSTDSGVVEMWKCQAGGGAHLDKRTRALTTVN